VLAQRIIPELESRQEPKLEHDSSDEHLDPPLPPVQGDRVNMQLGMIGLGRMGATWCGGSSGEATDCVVFDMSAKAVEELVQEKAVEPPT